MLPTFVIGLREGLEAALIVSIIATFLRKQGRTDLLRWVFAGVGIAIVLCLAVGIALDIVSRDLPQRQQEGLETVIGALAVVMVTYMVVWMRRHSRELKGSLEGAAATAMAGGSDSAARAMVLMAFLAVMREGFETVVFLLAAFNETGNSTAAVAGALLGILTAVALGWGIYKGGVRLNLSKFFRATGVVLVLVAAGLVVTAFHTAHEAGWLNAGQRQTIDLTWLVRPGSVHASLLTGMLGVQAHPVVIEVIAWLVYLIPVGIYVAWPPGKSIAARRVAVGTGVAGVLAAVAALVLVLVAPSPPAMRPVTTAGATTVQVVAGTGSNLVVNVSKPSSGLPGGNVRVHRTATVSGAGLTVDRYVTTVPAAGTSGLPATMSDDAVARFNGGRLPLGLAATANAKVPVTYTDSTTMTLQIEPQTQRVVSATWKRSVLATVHASIGPIPLSAPVLTRAGALPVATVTSAAAAARSDLRQIDRREDLRDAALGLGVLAALLVLTSLVFGLRSRRQPAPVLDTPSASLIGHQVSLT
jgi:high-affinity iron transporter